MVGRLCSLAEPAKVSLALDGAHLPTDEERWWAGKGFRVWVLGFNFKVTAKGFRAFRV